MVSWGMAPWSIVLTVSSFTNTPSDSPSLTGLGRQQTQRRGEEILDYEEPACRMRAQLQRRPAS
jgi:hypothetical protein